MQVYDLRKNTFGFGEGDSHPIVDGQVTKIEEYEDPDTILPEFHMYLDTGFEICLSEDEIDQLILVYCPEDNSAKQTT